MVRALTVAFREARTYLQDAGDLAFSLLLPIAIFALMYGAFGGESSFYSRTYVVNQDEGGAYSTLLLERLGKVDQLGVELLSASEADKKLERSDVLLALYIPSDFSQKIASGESAQLVFKQRGNGGQDGQIVASIVRGVVEGIAQELQVKSQVRDSLAGLNITDSRIDVTVQKLLERERESPTVTIREDVLGSRPDPVNQFLPGIMTMFVLFAVSLTARALVEERRKGTLERLLTTRLTVSELYMGKFLASLLRGFIQTLILLILTYAIFRIFTPVSFVSVLLVALVFSAAASALGLIIASVARTEDQAIWIAVFLTMAMTMLSGTFYHIAEGSFFYTLSRVSINTYAIDSFRTLISQGGSLADVGLEIGIMAAVIAVGLPLGRVLFRFMPGGK